ncbi:hypothetical protein SteCoe_15365 [Stentor coeruleus]|uniref:Uncharacterized protein n=1 Tax=Stentor coeruleus TaxID=5963 RepID=A0A1R2C3T7_9CILI|nr:hypothetical protein SteCoe_15365 [Stentor coeruleus]
MGCSPSLEASEIIVVKNEKATSKRSTLPAAPEPKIDLNDFKNINASLFVIGEENSKNEESKMPSHIGTIFSPQMTEYI